MERYKESWEAIFEAADLEDKNKEISWQQLKNPEDKVTKLLLFIYSMETFIPYEINRASREQD
jgi:hypothetical protein